VIAGVNISESTPSVVLSWGLGADSSAVLLRWLLEPDSREFDLSDLAVVVAMTGSEWERTRVDNEEAILPLLREHNVRLIQVARSGRYVTKDGAGVRVLSDTRQPHRIHLDGDYTLEQELLEAGTVAQVGGARTCSIHAKGDCLDPVVAAITRGHRYRHVIGFEVNEQARIGKDRRYNTALRVGEYPLDEWGWDRAAVLDYLREHTGVDWLKSACVFCPFALTSKAGRAAMLARYAIHIPEAVQVLRLEHSSLALNPKQGLLGETRLVDLVRAAGHQHLIAAFEAYLADAEHGLYEVRRIIRPRVDDPTKAANTARSVRRHQVGTHTDLTIALHSIAGDIEHDDLHTRVWLRRRSDRFPAVEHFWVVAPRYAVTKESPHFVRWWDEVTFELPAAA
jgi:hypothetical protein